MEATMAKSDDEKAEKARRELLELKLTLREVEAHGRDPAVIAQLKASIKAKDAEWRRFCVP
jgi:hypothetical protein